METTLGKRISFHRKRLGMTQEQLADHMGVSAQAVSKWENDQSCPDIALLPELAAFFGITVDELLGGPTQGVHVAEPVETSGPQSRPEKHRDYDIHIYTGLKQGLWFAGFVLLVGALLLTANLLKLDISWWTVTWTSALFMIGLCALTTKGSVFGLMVALAGAYFGLTAFGVLSFDLSWGLVIPIFLIAWGVSLVIDIFIGRERKKRRAMRGCADHKLTCNCSCEKGELKCEMAFGNAAYDVETPCLRSGEIETSFGDFTVDFSGAAAVADGCTLNVECNFGDLTLRVPSRYRVELDSSGSFSSSACKGTPDEAPAGVIRIKSEVSFGNVEVRYI